MSSPKRSPVETNTRNQNNIRVTVRIRPALQGETNKNLLQLHDDKTIAVSDENSTSQLFQFDALHSSVITQEDFFNKEVHPLLENVLQGYNATVFCYGITSSGKTYTMQGNDKEMGVIPRSFCHLVNTKPETSQISFSFLEIYNEKVFDLMNTNNTRELFVREDKNKKIIVADLSETQISSLDDFFKCYKLGLRNRKVGSNGINKESSRSHGIVCFTLKSKHLTSKLWLCDLAGCEDNRKTENTGIRMSESNSINTSLFTLRKCVTALNAGETRIPYRDSKLTRILQESLGGNSISLMIANIAPFASSDTMKTLHFAMKTKKIITTPVLNVEKVSSPLIVTSPPLDLAPVEAMEFIETILPEKAIIKEKENVAPMFSPRTKLVLAKDYIKRGKGLIEKKLFVEAVDYFKKAYKIIPDNEKLRVKIERIEQSISNENSDKNVLRSIQISKNSHDWAFLQYLNESSALQLLKMKSIGEKTADKILEHRPFYSLIDVTEIGMSQERVTKIMEANVDLFAKK